MKKKFLIVVACFVVVCSGSGQVKKLGGGINSGTYHELSPSVDIEQKYMVFQADAGEEGRWLVYNTEKGRDGKWQDRSEFLRINTTGAKTNYNGSQTVSYDGKRVYFTSDRFRGVQREDVWFVEKQADGSWSRPHNAGKPVNSKRNDGSASVGPNNKYMYFVRCESGTKIDSKEPCCAIYRSKRLNKEVWDDPVKLPAPVNKGCECHPRIMPDGETLVFASKRSGGEGGFDLYMTRNKGDGQWTEPRNMEFINTDGNDFFAGMTGRKDIMYFSANIDRTNDVYKIKVPEKFQRQDVIMVRGRVTGPDGKPIEALIKAAGSKDQKTRAVVTADKEDGSFFIVVPEGKEYDFSVTPRYKKDHGFYSSFLSVENLDKFRKEYKSLKLTPLTKGDTMTLTNIRFKEKSAELKDASTLELYRVFKILESNPSMKMEIRAHTDTVITDSLKSGKKLTEYYVDTLYNEPPYKVLTDTVEIDTAETDTAGLDEILNDSTAIKRDTIDLPEYELDTTWHNNRTPRQARAIRQLLIDKGVNKEQIKARGYGDRLKLVPNTSAANRRRNRRVDIKILEQ